MSFLNFYSPVRTN